MADSIESDDFAMQLAPIGEETLERLEQLFREKRLDSLVTARNPLDVTPAADDETHVEAARALCNDPGVDAVVIGLVPMSPSLGATLGDTEEAAIVPMLAELARQTTTPIVCTVDAGLLYEPLIRQLIAAGIPVFRSSDRAVSALSQYIEGRLNGVRIRNREIG